MSITKLLWVISSLLSTAGAAISLRLARVQAALQQWQLGFALYCQGEFVLLRDLWLASSALQHSTERLWYEPSPKTLQDFLGTVKKVRPRLLRRAYLLEPGCYSELTKALALLEYEALCQQNHNQQSGAFHCRAIAAFLNQHHHSRELINRFNDRVIATLGREVS
ncbi:MAG: hypothetical protein EA349_08930, partial [Halomonadaceae bacterium]